MAAPRQVRLTPAELDVEQRALYDSITGGSRGREPQLFPLSDASGGLEGPFNAMLLSPQLGRALQTLGSAVRSRWSLTDRAREIAILVVGHHWHSDFEIYAHEALARAAGLGDADFGALCEGRFDAIVDDEEWLIARTTYALAAHGDLTDAQYQAALESIGARALFELTTLVGYYAMLSMQLRVYRVSAPAGGSPS